MRRISKFIIEKLKLDDNIKTCERTPLDDEMELWDQRMRSPFGQCLKELQQVIIDLGVYPISKNEFGLSTYTPFDNYVTAYALDGNNKYTYNKIKDVCDNYEYVSYQKVKKVLKKLEKLV